MRGLLRAGLLLAPVVNVAASPRMHTSVEGEPEGFKGTTELDVPLSGGSDFPERKKWRQKMVPEWMLPKTTDEVVVDISNAIETSDPEKSLSLKFNIEINDSEKICGDGNFMVNGKKLDQEQEDDKFSGKSSMIVDGHDLEASWEFACVTGLDDRPMFRFVTFTINSIDEQDVTAQSLGFVSQFQQQSERTMIMFTTPDLQVQAPNPKADSAHGWESEHRELTLDEAMNDLHFLKHQMKELRWQIWEKKNLIARLDGKQPKEHLSDCDNIACVSKTLVHKIRGFAHHVAGSLSGHHETPPWYKGSELKSSGNHSHHRHDTKGNHSFHHPPHHGPHRHGRLPVCRFPPHPPHFGGGHHVPSREPHRGHHSPSTPPIRSHPDPEHKPSHPAPPHHPVSPHPPHKPHKNTDNVKSPSPPSPPSAPDHPDPPRNPPGFEGLHPHAPHDGPEHNRPHHGSPHHSSPMSFGNEHDRFDGPHGPRRPPFVRSLWLSLWVFLSILSIVIVFAVGRRCFFHRAGIYRKEFEHRHRAQRRERRLRRKEFRKAARKQAWREWALGLVRQMRVTLPITAEEEADYEEKRAMLMEEARFEAALEVAQEIGQLRRAADVVDDMVAVEAQQERLMRENRLDRMTVGRSSFESALPDYRSEAGDLPSYDDAETEVSSMVADGYRPGGYQYTPSNSSAGDAGSVRSILGDVKE